MSAVLTCVQGDLIKQLDCDAIVNAANSALLPGAGVCGRIHAAAGPELAEYCHGVGGIEIGGAVATPGFALTQDWVIHACGPRYGFDHPEAELLASAYRNALLVADEKGVRRIAFPAISTGVYGYPVTEAAKVAVAAIEKTLPELRSIIEVRLVLYDAVAHQVFAGAIKSRAGSMPDGTTG